MKTRNKHMVGMLSASTLFLGLFAASEASAASQGIANTRHNLGSNGQAFVIASGASATGTRTGSGGMGDVFTIGTDEICVFCHTPHGSNNTDASLPPLWNKATLASTTYSVYTSGTMNGTAPSAMAGHMSLACLSCHDGTQAMDNMINQPGQGGFNKTGGGANYMSGLRVGQTKNGGGTALGWHAGTNDLTAAEYDAGDTAAGKLISGAGVDFIGTDLSNDHPIGMSYGGGGCVAGTAGTQSSTCADTDFRNPSTGLGGMFEVATTGASAGNKTNMRIYGTTVGTATVECGSCHDPHTDAAATFLRKSNAASAVCLTCHVK